MKKKIEKPGRPRKERLGDEDVAFIKQQILARFRSNFNTFYHAVFDMVTDAKNGHKYLGLRQPNDVETVASAFKDAFQRPSEKARPLPELYWRAMKEIIGVSRDSLQSRSIPKAAILIEEGERPPETPATKAIIAADTSPDRLWDVSNASAIITVTISTVGLLDKLYDPIYLFINKQPDAFDQPEHRFKIEGDSQKIVVKLWGKEKQRITADELKKLPRHHYDHIKTLEQSMQAHYRLWQRIYPKRNSSPDALENEKTDMQIRKLIVEMGKDLSGIIWFLESIGLQLDDHYKNIRHLCFRV